MEFGGFLGEITFVGELDELTKLARLTEHLHLGKNTVFGLGKFTIKNLPMAK
jgi:CRISPR/Cas system endoribonuclease Cas6 (RAMP superfamily)